MSAYNILTVPEVANELRIGETFVREMVYRHEIPFVKIGRRILFQRADLDKWLEEHRTPADRWADTSTASLSGARA